MKRVQPLRGMSPDGYTVGTLYILPHRYINHYLGTLANTGINKAGGI